MKTCNRILRIPDDVSGTERVRDFQPPWRTVVLVKCPDCGHVNRLRKNWRGPDPRFGIRCSGRIEETPDFDDLPGPGPLFENRRFKVVAKSSNTNSFGLHQYILIGLHGEAWKVHRTLSLPWEVGKVLDVLCVDGEPQWAKLSCELPDRLPDADDATIHAAWEK